MSIESRKKNNSEHLHNAVGCSDSVDTVAKPVIILHLDIDPMAMPRPRVTRRGTYNPGKFTKYKEDIVWMVRSQYHGRMLTGALKMDVTFYLKKPRGSEYKKMKFPTKRPDLDNYIKGVCDALEGICYRDDAQIVTCCASKMYAGAGRIVVKFTALTN